MKGLDQERIGTASNNRFNADAPQASLAPHRLNVRYAHPHTAKNGEMMDIEFNWDTPDSSGRHDAEEEIRHAILEELEIDPCHEGVLRVNLSWGDPLEHTVVGFISCSQGHQLASLRGSPKGAPMTYNIIRAANND